MSIFDKTKLAKGFKTDKGAEENGVWRFHAESGIMARIRRATLPEHKRALRKHYRPFAHLTRVDPVDELRLKMKAGAEVLVADWGYARLDELGQPLKDADGQYVIDPLTGDGDAPIVASETNVYEAFAEMPDFFQWVSDEADTFEHYRLENVREAAGNSSASSAGKNSGEAPKPPLSSIAEQPEVPASAPSTADQS